MGAVALKPVHRTRLKNLSEIVEKRFEGNASEAARAIGRSHTFMWQLMNGYRSIGEETARNIERALKLGANALDGDGAEGKVADYHMVPVLTLDALDVKPKVFRPCPESQCGDKTFSAEVMSEEMAELRPGDIVFADRADIQLQMGKLFVVREKRAKSARILQAKKGARWVFRATSPMSANDKPLDAADVHIVGRVILVVRDLR